MGGGDFKHWTHVFDGKFVKIINTFSQLFPADGPTVDQLFFFLILSPLLHLISPLFSVLSLMSQNSPNSYPRNEKTHPPLNSKQRTGKMGFPDWWRKTKTKNKNQNPLTKKVKSRFELGSWSAGSAANQAQSRAGSSNIDWRPWSSAEPWMLWGVDGELGVQGFGHTVRE